MGRIIIGIADLNIVRVPDVIITIGLGSCVGIALYDPVIKLAGLVHIMLPSSTQVNDATHRAKFADTGISDLMNLMIKNGASRPRLTAKIAGGAHMFAGSITNSDIMKVGQRNVAATKEMLARLRIPIRAEDTGGTFGRTVEFYSENGVYLIKTINHGVKQI